MIGAAVESMVINLRDLTARKLDSFQRGIPQGLNDWKIKTVADSLHKFLESQNLYFDSALRAQFEASWTPIIQQIRTTRNDAGHPINVDPVTPDTVHASLLVFPELAKLSTKLRDWISTSLK